MPVVTVSVLAFLFIYKNNRFANENWADYNEGIFEGAKIL